MTLRLALGLLIITSFGCKPKPANLPQDTAAGDDDDVVGDDDDVVGDDDDVTGDDDDDVPDGIRFDAHIAAEILGAKYASTGDLDGDGTAEIVVGAANNITEADIPYGTVTILTYGGDLDTWSEEQIISEADRVRSPNHPTLGDIDGDGQLDVVVATGSRYCEAVEAVGACGGIVALLNNNGNFDRQIVIDRDLHFYLSVDLADINGDGNLDIVTTGERLTLQVEEARVRMWPGNGDGTFGAMVELGSGLGPWTTVQDIDGDGDLDLMSGERSSGDSFAWMENDGAANFTRHVISESFGKGFMIRFVDDLYGDGVTRALASNHTNTESPNNPDLYDSQLVAFEIPSDPTGQWSSYDTLTTDIVPPPDLGLFPNDAPGTFDWGDADGDGDLDILLAGDGDPTVYLLDQESPGQFTTRILRDNLVLSGGTVMQDFTGDGAVEFVTASYGTDAVYVIERIDPN